MALPVGVLTVYAALAIWAVFLLRGFRLQSFRPFLFWGIGLMLFLNAGYLIFGVPASIASFIGIYDVLINVGLDDTAAASGVSTCAGNACTVWGERYINHSAWGSAFYDRFANGPAFRSTLLLGHITFNSLVFVLMHIQLFRPGYDTAQRSHRMLGRTTFALLTISIICAVWLASEHAPVTSYGGILSEYGFYSMSAFVYGSAVMGIVAIRRGDAAQHRVWMFRFVGSMWGSFWLFRVMLFVLDPLLRNYEAASLLICIWASAPLGILIAELVRRRIDRRKPLSPVTTVTAA